MPGEASWWCWPSRRILSESKSALNVGSFPGREMPFRLSDTNGQLAWCSEARPPAQTLQACISAGRVQQ